MGFLISALTSRLAGPIASILCVVLGCFLIGAMVSNAGLKVRLSSETKRADKFEAAYEDWRDYGKAEKLAYDASERLRGRETQNARRAVSEASGACDARVREARRSAAAIRRLVTEEPARDPQGCPVRRLLDPARVSDALAPTPAR